MNDPVPSIHGRIALPFRSLSTAHLGGGFALTDFRMLLVKLCDDARFASGEFAGALRQNHKTVGPAFKSFHEEYLAWPPSHHGGGTVRPDG